MRIEKQGQVIKVIEVLKISYKSLMQTRIIYMYFKQKLKAALKGKIISTFWDIKLRDGGWYDLLSVHGRVN